VRCAAANPPNPEARRQLILIAKVIQAAANNVKFGQKEPHLIPCNAYLDEIQPYFNKLLADFAVRQNFFELLCWKKKKKHSLTLIVGGHSYCSTAICSTSINF